jgi:hypothetical protein
MAPSLLRRLRRLIAASLAISGLLGAEEKQPSPGFTEDDLPLPMWNQEEWQKIAREAAPAPLGGLLPSLGEDPNLTPTSLGPALSPKYADAPPPLFPEDPEALRASISLFLPNGLPSQTTPNTPPRENQRPTPVIHLKDVTPEFLASAEAWLGEDPLIDPAVELAETQAEDLRRFLGYHAEKSHIPIVVLVLPKDEKLPATTSLDTIAQGSLSARRAALLVYPIGEPWRARLFLPHSAHEAVSTTFLTRLVEACLTQADTASTPEDQLHEYVVQLSIRLFWLQKELNKSDSSSKAFADTAQTPSLAEVGPSTPLPPATPLPAPYSLPHFLELPSASLITIAILLGFLLAIAGRRLVRLAKTRATQRRHRQIWTLPEAETTPRLGGAFCGGSGAWRTWK